MKMRREKPKMVSQEFRPARIHLDCVCVTFDRQNFPCRFCKTPRMSAGQGDIIAFFFYIGGGVRPVLCETILKNSSESSINDFKPAKFEKELETVQ